MANSGRLRPSAIIYQEYLENPFSGVADETPAARFPPPFRRPSPAFPLLPLRLPFLLRPSLSKLISAENSLQIRKGRSCSYGDDGKKKYEFDESDKKGAQRCGEYGY